MSQCVHNAVIRLMLSSFFTPLRTPAFRTVTEPVIELRRRGMRKDVKTQNQTFWVQAHWHFC